MTTNISESLNAMLVKVREFSITAFVNEIRLLCQKWFHECHTKAGGYSSMMSKDVETKLEQRKDRAQAMGVSFLMSLYNNQVIQYLIQQCCLLQLSYFFPTSQFGRSYVPISIRSTSLTVIVTTVLIWPYGRAHVGSSNQISYLAITYWLQFGKLHMRHTTCAHFIIQGSFGMKHIEVSSVPFPTSARGPYHNKYLISILQPPDVRIVAGRRRKQRVPSIGEELPIPKCSRYKERGHNRATCQNPIALHPTDQAECPGSTLPTDQPTHPSDQESMQHL